MAPRPNVTINKTNGNLGRRAPNTDAVMGMVISAPAVVGKLQNGVVYPMNSADDAVAIGITAAYDTANSVLVYHHISRFFIRNPNATLYVITAPQTASLTDMVNPAGNYAPVLLRSQNGAIKYTGVARNPAAGYEPVLTSGLDGDVLTAVADAQALYNSEFAKFRYSGFLIEGRSFNGTAAASTNLRELACTNVSVTIAADMSISGANAAYSGYAALGDVLGLKSLCAVSQDLGELDPAFNLQNTGLGLFVKAGLSSGLPMSSYSDADLDTLNTNGYLFPDVTAGVPGYYISDSHVCAPIAGNDYAYIENNSTIEKAIFLARTAILPLLKSRLKVDPATGFLLPQVCKSIETTGNRSLAGMQTDGDISGGIDTYVDPNQNLLAGANLNIAMTFVIVSIGRAITISIGFSNPLNTSN
jgi:hypothetical protein